VLGLPAVAWVGAEQELGSSHVAHGSVPRQLEVMLCSLSALICQWGHVPLC